MNDSKEINPQPEANKLAKRNASGLAKSITQIEDFQQLEKLVDFVYNSPTFNGMFKVNETKDGKTLSNVDRNGIATCMMLGVELGFSPMESIMMKSILNADAVIKVHKGRDLGLSPMNALQNIYVFRGKNGNTTIYTSINIVNKCLNDGGVVPEILNDGTEPTHKYLSVRSNEFVDYDSNTMIILNIGHSKEIIETALREGKMPVKRSSEYKATVKLTRGDRSITISYSLQQAIDAGLYRGTTSQGVAVDGKDNWNNHPMQHLIKMCIMIGARMIVADKLNGVYGDFEITQAGPIEAEDAEIIED